MSKIFTPSQSISPQIISNSSFNYKEENSKFKMDKPGKHQLNPVIRANFSINGTN